MLAPKFSDCSKRKRFSLQAVIRLVEGRLAHVVSLSVPYFVVGSIFSVVFVWQLNHVNPETWTPPVMQIASLLWNAFKLVVLVLLVIAFWRALFLGEEPRLQGLHVAPSLFLGVFLRVLLIAMIATFFAQATYNFSFRMIEHTRQLIRGRSQYLIYDSGASFVIYSIGT